MRMLSIARFAVSLAILFTVPALMSSRALAQGDPAAITGLSSKREAFTQEEVARIRAFGNHWVRRLTREGASPQEIDEARRRLMEPLRGRGQSDLFRSEYGDILMSDLLTSVDRESTAAHASSNALVVLSRIGTERALDAMVDRCSSRTTASAHVRLSASRGARELLRLSDTSRITIRKRQQIARRMRDAAAAESDAFVLRHQLHAIFHCDHSSVDNETRAELLGHLSGALTAVAERSADSALLLNATSPVVFDVLQSFLQIDSAAQTVVARAMTPGLVRLLEAYHLNAWASELNQSDPERISREVTRVERCLQTLFPFAQPNRTIPATNLESAWLARDTNRFRSELELWKQATR